MKNRFYLLVMIALIIPVFAGCKSTGQSGYSTDETQSSLTASQSVKSPMSVYKSVLHNKTHFFSTDSKKDLYISQLNQAISDDSSVKAKATKFAVVDLDNNDTPEIVLWLSVNNNEYFGFEVLSYRNEVVYGYTIPYRAFMDLKSDGTFSFSSGAADNGFGTITFSGKGYNINNISYSKSSYDSSNNQVISYFVNQEVSSEEDFLKAINEQSEKPGVTWYDFTDDNIETLF